MDLDLWSCISWQIEMARCNSCRKWGHCWYWKQVAARNRGCWWQWCLMIRKIFSAADGRAIVNTWWVIKFSYFFESLRRCIFDCVTKTFLKKIYCFQGRKRCQFIWNLLILIDIWTHNEFQLKFCWIRVFLCHLQLKFFIGTKLFISLVNELFPFVLCFLTIFKEFERVEFALD